MKSSLIFLDTNIFIKENFLSSERINEFLKLSREGTIRLISTPITILEIKSNFKKRVVSAIEAFGNFRNNNKVVDILRNTDRGREILSTALNEKQLIEEFNDKLDKVLLESKVEIIPFSEINIEPIFNDYKKGNPPFNTSDKKAEFPDAIAIKLIENWCEKNNELCIILTGDKAFQKYQHSRLDFKEDYKAFLTEITFTETMHHTFKFLKEEFALQEEEIIKQMKKWVDDQLDDWSKYYEVSNWLEIHNIEVKEVTVDFDISDEEIGLNILSLDSSVIRLEIFATVSYTVVIEIDDENSSVYDSEDKEMMYLDTTNVTLDRTEYVPIILAYDYSDEDEGLLEIKTINNDKPLKVKAKNEY